MTSTNNTAGKQSVDDESANLFVAFRHFADEQMSSLLQSIIGLPSAFHSSSWKSQSSEDEAWLKEAREFGCDLARESEEAAKIVSIFQKAFEEGRKRPPDQSCIPPNDYKQDKMMAHRSKEPPLDPESLPCCSPFLFSGLSRAILAQGGLGARPLWPVVYTANSPYSPLWLEQQATEGNKWRNAFDDLLALQSEDSMAEKNAQSECQSGGSWMTSMLARGFFGKSWQIMDAQSQRSEPPLAAAVSSTRLPYDPEENEATELDPYERFLDVQYPSPLASSAPENDGQGLISTLTTTERNKLPDGSIHTKVVHKKLFSDGREESIETLHTSYDSQQPIPKDAASGSTVRAGPIPQRASNLDVKEPKRKGWFWS